MHVLGEVKDTLFFYNTRKIMTTGVHLTTFPAPDCNIRQPQNQIDCPSPSDCRGLRTLQSLFRQARQTIGGIQTAHREHTNST